MRGNVEYFVSLKQRLEAAQKGERGELVSQAATLMGLSTATIYRRLERVGWSSGRKTRSDCGTLCVGKELAITVGGILRATTRANGKRTLPLSTTVKILEDNGMGVVNKKTGEVTMPHPSTISRAMQIYGCHPDQADKGSPAQGMRSLHVNHVWQMDASVCVIFYLPDGKVVAMDERKFNERKPANLAKLTKQRVVRWIITDHRSGSFYLEYTLGNEDADTAIKVLSNAMCKRADENDLFYGAPVMLYTDPGSAYRAAITQGFLKRLGVESVQHAPGNARASGQVESTQNLVERQFEGRLRLLNVQNLEELNAQATAWRIAYHANAIHQRYKKTRNAMWLTIQPEELRIPQSLEALQALVRTEPISRTIDNKLTFSFEGKTYSVHGIEGISNKTKIMLTVNPYQYPAVDITVTEYDGRECVYTIHPIQKDRAGFALDAPVFGQEYKNLADTTTDKAIKDMDKAAYNASTLEEAAKAKAKGSIPFAEINVMADVEAARRPTYIPKRGSDLALEGGRALPTYSHIEAALQLRPRLAAAGVEWTSAHLAYVKRSHPDRVPAEALDVLFEHFLHSTQAENQSPKTLRLVV